MWGGIQSDVPVLGGQECQKQSLQLLQATQSNQQQLDTRGIEEGKVEYETSRFQWAGMRWWGVVGLRKSRTISLNAKPEARKPFPSNASDCDIAEPLRQ
jgi:hypothetical protein